MITIFLLSLCGMMLHGSETREFTIRSFADKSSIYIGDHIRYTIEITFPPHARLRRQGPGTGIGKFEIVDYIVHEPFISNGIARERMEYIITSYETGDYKIPAAEAVLIISNREYPITAAPIRITVQSLSGNRVSEEDMFGNEPQALPKGEIARRYIITGIALTIIILLTIAGFAYKIKRARETAKFIPAHVEAENALASLRSEGLFAKQDYRGLYYRLSFIFRRFLERIHGVPCTTMTTSQIIEAFAQKNDPGIDFFRNFFSYADRVKFASEVPSNEQTQQFFKIIDRFVSEERLRYMAVLAEKKGIK